MKSNIFILILIFLISCSRNRNQEVLESYIAAHNEHEIEKELAFYGDDIEFELKNTWTKKGLNEMRSLAEWDAALNSNLKLESITTKEDSIFCKVVENNDWFKAVNIYDLEHDPTVFIIQNGKIVKIIGYPTEKTGKEIQAVIGSLFQWSQIEKDSTLNELIRGNQFVYSTEAAEKWLDLFTRWKESTENQSTSQ